MKDFLTHATSFLRKSNKRCKRDCPLEVIDDERSPDVTTSPDRRLEQSHRIFGQSSLPYLSEIAAPLPMANISNRQDELEQRAIDQRQWQTSQHLQPFTNKHQLRNFAAKSSDGIIDKHRGVLSIEQTIRSKCERSRSFLAHDSTAPEIRPLKDRGLDFSSTGVAWSCLNSRGHVDRRDSPYSICTLSHPGRYKKQERKLTKDSGYETSPHCESDYVSLSTRSDSGEALSDSVKSSSVEIHSGQLGHQYSSGNYMDMANSFTAEIQRKWNDQLDFRKHDNLSNGSARLHLDVDKSDAGSIHSGSTLVFDNATCVDNPRAIASAAFQSDRERNNKQLRNPSSPQVPKKGFQLMDNSAMHCSTSLSRPDIVKSAEGETSITKQRGHFTTVSSSADKLSDCQSPNVDINKHNFGINRQIISHEYYPKHVPTKIHSDYSSEGSLAGDFPELHHRLPERTSISSSPKSLSSSEELIDHVLAADDLTQPTSIGKSYLRVNNAIAAYELDDIDDALNSTKQYHHTLVPSTCKYSHEKPAGKSSFKAHQAGQKQCTMPTRTNKKLLSNGNSNIFVDPVEENFKHSPRTVVQLEQPCLPKCVSSENLLLDRRSGDSGFAEDFAPDIRGSVGECLPENVALNSLPRAKKTQHRNEIHKSNQTIVCMNPTKANVNTPSQSRDNTFDRESTSQYNFMRDSPCKDEKQISYCHAIGKCNASQSRLAEYSGSKLSEPGLRTSESLFAASTDCLLNESQSAAHCQPRFFQRFNSGQVGDDKHSPSRLKQMQKAAVMQYYQRRVSSPSATLPRGHRVTDGGTAVTSTPVHVNKERSQLQSFEKDSVPMDSAYLSSKSASHSQHLVVRKESKFSPKSALQNTPSAGIDDVYGFCAPRSLAVSSDHAASSAGSCSHNGSGHLQQISDVSGSLCCVDTISCATSYVKHSQHSIADECDHRPPAAENVLHDSGTTNTGPWTTTKRCTPEAPEALHLLETSSCRSVNRTSAPMLLDIDSKSSGSVPRRKTFLKALGENKLLKMTSTLRRRTAARHAAPSIVAAQRSQSISSKLFGHRRPAFLRVWSSVDNSSVPQVGHDHLQYSSSLAADCFTAPNEDPHVSPSSATACAGGSLRHDPTTSTGRDKAGRAGECTQLWQDTRSKSRGQKHTDALCTKSLPRTTGRFRQRQTCSPVVFDSVGPDQPSSLIENAFVVDEQISPSTSKCHLEPQRAFHEETPRTHRQTSLITDNHGQSTYHRESCALRQGECMPRYEGKYKRTASPVVTATVTPPATTHRDASDISAAGDGSCFTSSLASYNRSISFSRDALQHTANSLSRAISSRSESNLARPTLTCVAVVRTTTSSPADNDAGNDADNDADLKCSRTASAMLSRPAAVDDVSASSSVSCSDTDQPAMSGSEAVSKCAGAAECGSEDAPSVSSLSPCRSSSCTSSSAGSSTPQCSDGAASCRHFSTTSARRRVDMLHVRVLAADSQLQRLSVQLLQDSAEPQAARRRLHNLLVHFADHLTASCADVRQTILSASTDRCDCAGRSSTCDAPPSSLADNTCLSHVPATPPAPFLDEKSLSELPAGLRNSLSKFEARLSAVSSSSGSDLTSRDHVGDQDLATTASSRRPPEEQVNLVYCISGKLQVLRAEREAVREEMNVNTQLGDNISQWLQQQAAPQHQLDKYNTYVQQISTVTSLLLGLAARLARAEALLSHNCPHSTSVQSDSTSSLSARADCTVTGPVTDNDLTSLQEKRDKLSTQLEEARCLKRSIDDRGLQLLDSMKLYLSDSQMHDYRHFISMKAKFAMDARELDDKIRLGQEQLAAALCFM